MEWKAHLIQKIAELLLTVFSLFAWGYVLAVRDEAVNGVLVAALIGNGIVLVGNLLFYVGLYGYRDGFRRHLQITCLAAVFLTFIALFILGTGDTSGADGRMGFSLILQFLVNLLVSVLLSVLPSLLDCGLLWLIVHIFGKADDE